MERGSGCGGTASGGIGAAVSEHVVGRCGFVFLPYVVQPTTITVCPPAVCVCGAASRAGRCEREMAVHLRAPPPLARAAPSAFHRRTTPRRTCVHAVHRHGEPGPHQLLGARSAARASIRLGAERARCTFWQASPLGALPPSSAQHFAQPSSAITPTSRAAAARLRGSC